MKTILASAAVLAALAAPATATAAPTKADRAVAVKVCKTAKDANATAFKTQYGTNKNKRNAFGKCVSQTARAVERARTNPETRSAAKACRGELTADAAAFETRYGTGKGKADAFGRCVSQKVAAQDD